MKAFDRNIATLFPASSVRIRRAYLHFTVHPLQSEVGAIMIPQTFPQTRLRGADAYGAAPGMSLEEACDAPEVATDRALLEAFVALRDETAFQTLLQRHGRLVRGVCGRIVRDPADADDAFQAVFLTLVRKAPEVLQRMGNASSLTGWFHRVGVNAALQWKRRVRRQRRREDAYARRKPAGDDGRTTAGEPWREALAELDETLRDLPEAVRAPLVLCYLEGQTQDEAAAHLGMTYATVRRRLQQGKELLHQRFLSRGIAVSTAGFAALWETARADATTPDPAVQRPLCDAAQRFANNGFSTVPPAELVRIGFHPTTLFVGLRLEPTPVAFSVANALRSRPITALALPALLLVLIAFTQRPADVRTTQPTPLTHPNANGTVAATFVPNPEIPRAETPIPPLTVPDQIVANALAMNDPEENPAPTVPEPPPGAAATEQDPNTPPLPSSPALPAGPGSGSAQGKSPQTKTTKSAKAKAKGKTAANAPSSILGFNSPAEAQRARERQAQGLPPLPDPGNARAFQGMLQVNGRMQKFSDPEAFRKAAEAFGVGGLPGVPAFDGMVNVNGRVQRFGNPNAMRRALGGLPGVGRGAFPAGNGNGAFPGFNGNGAFPGFNGNGAFSGMVNINGRTQTFQNPRDFAKARDQLFPGLTPP